MDRFRRLNANEIIVSTRSTSKLAGLKTLWEGITIAENNAEVIQKAKYIFICVKPLEVKNVLLEVKDYINQDTNIISIAGPVPIKFIEELTHAKVSKLTPSLTSEVMEGISLLCHGSSVIKEEKDFIETLLNGISKVKIINEDEFELAVELTSCMPGFIASIFDELVKSSLQHTDTLSKSDVEDMVIRTLLGTAKLFVEKRMGFEEMVQRVATKGGITEEGVKVFKAKLPDIFDEMFMATLNKRKIARENIELNFHKED